MSLHHRLAALQQHLEDRHARTPLILLHPENRYRSAYIAYTLQTTQRPILYHALGKDIVDVVGFLNAFIHDVAHQYPIFGRHLNLLYPDARHNSTSALDALLIAFVQDLQTALGLQFTLILDEFDHADEVDEMMIFIDHLIDRLPAGSQIIINSRTLPRLPWVALIAAGKAAVVSDHEDMERGFYTPAHDHTILPPWKEQEDQSTYTQYIETLSFGPGFVLLDDKSIDLWEGHLPRLLLFYALDRPFITRSELCAAFWPELDEDQAINVFHVTKRRLHKALPFSEEDVLLHHDLFYRLNARIEFTYDAARFSAALVAARNPANPDPAASWQHAIDLYRGSYLQGHQGTWIERRRKDYQAGYIEALTQLARRKEAENRYETALMYYQRALTESPHPADLYQQVLRLFIQLGRRSEAINHYRTMTELEAKTQIAIDTQTRQMYADLLA